MAGPRLLLAPTLGFGIWAVAFVAIYVVQGVGCELGWNRVSTGPVSLLRVLLVALTAISLAVAILAARYLSARRRAARAAAGPAAMILAVASICAWQAVPAIALTFSGVVALSACD